MPKAWAASTGWSCAVASLLGWTQGLMSHTGHSGTCLPMSSNTHRALSMSPWLCLCWPGLSPPLSGLACSHVADRRGPSS